MHNVVIIGAGHAAGQLIASLKQKKFAGHITLLGDEDYLPYQRPPLSKKFLQGELPIERLFVKPPSFYEQPNIDVRLKTKVVAIQRSAKTVNLADGATVAYDTLVLATGSRVRKLAVEGHDLPGIHYLRTVSDVEAIRSDLAKASKMAIVGAGYIGLEVAAVGRSLGLDVTVVEMAERVMSRVVSRDVSRFYEQEHRRNGVKLALLTGLRSFVAGADQRIAGIETSDGDRIDADLIVVGVGVNPNTDIAVEAELQTDNGIAVDSRCRTSDAAIYAMGDCTSHESRLYGRRIRLESVQNALEQAKTVASNICGELADYDEVPWFWSDQYDLKLQIAGLSEGYDQTVIRGNPAERSFACLYLSDGKLIACDAINAPREFMQSKGLISAAAEVDPEQLQNPAVPLKDLAG